MAEMKIARVECAEGSKIGKVFFEGHEDKPIKFWSSNKDRFGSELAAGVSAEATFETVKSQKDGYPDEKFLKSWGGIKAKAFGGGGGGRPSQPKTPVEIHASCVAGIIKSAIEQGDVDGSLAKTHLKIYEETVAKWS